MSLEAKIDELNATVSKLIGVLQLSNAQATGAAAAKPEAPTKQTRGRAAATETPKQEAPPADDGGFLDEPAAPAVEYTIDDVRAALVAYQKAVNSQDKARKLLKEEGGADTLGTLAKDKYAAVVTKARSLTPKA